MKTLRQAIFYITVIISVLLILLSLLSLIHDFSYWYSKALDFPRLQYLILALVCLILFPILNKSWGFASWMLVAGLSASILIHATRILPYLVGEKKVPDAKATGASKENIVGILIANVLVTNRQAEKFLQIVDTTDPDMLLVMEVDQWWVNQLQPLEELYPYTMEYPLDNAYGMALYSKLPLEQEKILFLKHKDVPSFHARVVLPSNRAFMFHGVHPVAPFPSEKYPDNVGEKEVALLKIGDLVASAALPSIVAGDFNDVSWSYTTRLFEGEGELNNVRLGRGLYNTFDATSAFLRWPLDHYFVTKEFSLLELKRLPAFHSDHFPMFAQFRLNEH